MVHIDKLENTQPRENKMALSWSISQNCNISYQLQLAILEQVIANGRNCFHGEKQNAQHKINDIMRMRKACNAFEKRTHDDYKQYNLVLANIFILFTYL